MRKAIVTISASRKYLAMIAISASTMVACGLAGCLNTGSASSQPMATESQKGIQYYNAPQETVEAWRGLKFGTLIQWGPSVFRGKEISWSRYGADAQAHQAGALDPEYDNYYKRFKAENFDAMKLCQTLKDSGMRFATFCNKHHDGFCMWDTQLSDYKSTSPLCPAGRDFTKEWAAACRATGLKHGLYVSQPDWLDPDYFRSPEAHARYIQRLHGWMRELCSNYGQVDIIFFDGLGGLASNWGSADLLRMIRGLQPKAMINSRCGAYDVKGWPAHQFMPFSVEETRKLPLARGFPADYDTPESWIGTPEIARMQSDRPWETCSPLQRGQWSYGADVPFMSAKEVLQLLIGIVGMDGSLSLSVAIRPDGTFDERHVAVLKEVGQWLGKYGASIYETRGGPFLPTSHGVSTCAGNRIFLHLTQWPGDTLVLPAIQRKLLRSSLLTGGTAQVTQDAKGAIRIVVPKDSRQEIDTIVVLELDGPAQTAKPGQLALGSLAAGKKARVRASNVYSGQPYFAAQNAVDNDTHTRWATDFATKEAWLDVDLGAKQEFNSVLIKEDGGFVRRFDVEILKDGKWVAVVSGKRIGDTYHAGFPTVKSQRVRLHILDAVCAPQYPGRLHGLNSHMAAFTGPAIWEFQVLLDPQPPPAIPLLVNPPVPPPPEIGLDTLEPISFKTGWQGPNATTWRNVNCHGQPLVVDGEKFQHGVGMHANAEAVFAVKPEYQRFVGRIGIDDAAAGRGSIIATVFLDDKQLYRSPVLSGGDGLWNLDVKLSGATEQSVLRLVIKDAGDGYDGDNADLVDAGFMVPGR